MNVDETSAGIDRRHFLAAGAAGIAGATLTANTASAQTVVPGKPLKMNATKGGKRVAIINDALLQIGPPLARGFAEKGYNLVIAQPAEGLVKECEGHGAKVVVVPGIEQHGPDDERRPDSTQKLVDAAMKEFGGFDSAYIRTAQHMPGDIFQINAEDMQLLYEGNFLAVVYALQSVLPPLMEKGAGQVVILTSASSTQALSDFIGYSAMRAAANTLIQGAAMTAAPKGVCVNAFGTNFLNYPDAVDSYGGPERMAAVASNIPVGRFGEPEEMAHLAMALLDGYNMFTTGQSFMVAGGYNVKLDSIASLISG
ncbi:MAG: SDR family NAD(P)-dependent oxidoreductase [Planctomycetota bacterium]|jgi:3-oxoacyl-[acyl-carrier protein] reductase